MDQFSISLEKFKSGREWSNQAVGRAMKALGYVSTSKNNKRYYQGIRFKQHKNIVDIKSFIKLVSKAGGLVLKKLMQ